MARVTERLRVLFLSRNYPNGMVPELGPWVQGLVREVAAHCAVKVIAPVPYCPPVPGSSGIAYLRRIPGRESVNQIDVLHPRFPTGPGYSLHSFEGATYYWGIRSATARLRREFAFDLVHAHFTYPDGVAAAKIGLRYGVPVVITEHAPWVPWMERYPRVRAAAVAASHASAFHIAVSRYARDTIERFTGRSARLRVIPNGVDGDVFAPPLRDDERDPNLILYVGRIHSIKGVDILLRAMKMLIRGHPAARLLLLGGDLRFRHAQEEGRRLRALARDLDLEGSVEFAGPKPPRDVAAMMGRCAALVLPSRAESFGSVLIEALACGTPVVATRCGGPEDIVNDEVGMLVPSGDVEALATGISAMLTRRRDYDPRRLRAFAMEEFSWSRIARRVMELYTQALLISPVSPTRAGPRSVGS